MKWLTTLILFCGLPLAGCSVLNGKPASPPAPEKQAVEISRNMVGSLTRAGKVTVDEHGSPMDAKNALQRQADEHQARYYQILMIDETVTPGVWHGEAILYR
ncbi:Lipoprotein BsmA precursor [Sodalis glossinidius str. 'morsitans']|uniref:Lipoprotein BsmA n=1 Tax=Sodalis glossinidius (strain morsitans) TaxID=343509 RepID=A0A193QFU7_SODGM|nr:biofilm peroxide resistance protein BsmA [Sodalis glossinidius]CRL44022.1 Lipoprotein BsmA precursor [Sodalis glossinidius str. 'morsitans']